MDELRVKFDGQVSKRQVHLKGKSAEAFRHDGTLVAIFTSESHPEHFKAFSKFWGSYHYHEAYEVALAVVDTL